MSAEKSRKARFNIVDALVLAAVLLVAAGVCYQLFSAQIKNAAAQKATLKFTATVYYAREGFLESVKGMEFPAQMVAGNSYVADAYVTGMTYKNSILKIDMPDGQVSIIDDPVLFDITFTMEAVIPKDSPILKVGAQEVRFGKGFVVKTRTLEIGSTIVELTLTDL